MSREHLYKAKRVNWRELPKEDWWVEGCLLIDYVSGQYFIHAYGNSVNESDKVNEEGCLKFFAYEVDPETVCQHTGLTDKSCRKIYEGDIVLDLTSGYIGIIRFGLYKLKHYGFYVDWIKSCDYRCDIVFWVTNRLIRSIGNIFDNPEFLKDGQQPESPIT